MFAISSASDSSLRILALTPAGQRELRDPRAGLSLPQRWLLVRSEKANHAEQKTLAKHLLVRLPG